MCCSTLDQPPVTWSTFNQTLTLRWKTHNLPLKWSRLKTIWLLESRGKQDMIRKIKGVFNSFLFVDDLCHYRMKRSKLSDKISFILFQLLSSKIGHSQTYNCPPLAQILSSALEEVCTAQLLTISLLRVDHWRQSLATQPLILISYGSRKFYRGLPFICLV